MIKMMDNSKVWLVPEGEEEEKLFNVLKRKLLDPAQLTIDYSAIKKLLKMDYITFGTESTGEKGVCGIVIFGKHVLTDRHFQREVIVRNEYFKPFFRYLTKGMELREYLPIDFYFKVDNPVIVQIGPRMGIIAPCISSEYEFD